MIEAGEQMIADQKSRVRDVMRLTAMSVVGAFLALIQLLRIL